MSLIFLIIALLLFSSLPIYGQTAADSILTIVKELDEIEIVQQRTANFVSQKPEKLIVDIQAIRYMPKFLGTSDPIRYLQSLPGVQTNNETTAGLHINGCEDYQTLVTINKAPVYYPNHLLGLYSTFIGPHFKQIELETSVHNGTMPNRIGGMANFITQNSQPKRFSFEGNIGIVNSDITFSIPMGKKHSLFISARSSYINWLYSRFMKVDQYNIRYHFQDYNLTYVGDLTEKDKIVLSAFYSRDKMRIFSDNEETNVSFPWQNIVSSFTWTHRLYHGLWRSTAYYSFYDNAMDIKTNDTKVNTYQQFASVGLKNNFGYQPLDNIHLSASLDYEHYFNKPLYFSLQGINAFQTDSSSKALEHADELSLGIDIRHDVCDWFAYNGGVHFSGFKQNKSLWGAIDPRFSVHFSPARDHTISIHYGIYHQYFHKSGLTDGGLPTDFFFLASDDFKPEWAHSTSIKYVNSFLNNQYSASAEIYFKQIYNIVESTSNVLMLLNKKFSIYDNIVTGNGRNYGFNLMFQRNKGIITGYISYSLGWAKRSLPGLEGYTDYRYSASSERLHDLKIVLNSRFAKRWNISAMFVLATGLPFTEAKEAYMLNGKMMCLYSTYNGTHMPLYHRLDLSCSCDIIKTKEHELGINLSVYNVYAHKNAQFVTYGKDLRPTYSSLLSTIIPSISIYGKF